MIICSILLHEMLSIVNGATTTGWCGLVVESVTSHVVWFRGYEFGSPSVLGKGSTKPVHCVVGWVKSLLLVHSFFVTTENGATRIWTTIKKPQCLLLLMTKYKVYVMGKTLYILLKIYASPMFTIYRNPPHIHFAKKVAV